MYSRHWYLVQIRYLGSDSISRFKSGIIMLGASQDIVLYYELLSSRQNEARKWRKLIFKVFNTYTHE